MCARVGRTLLSVAFDFDFDFGFGFDFAPDPLTLLQKKPSSAPQLNFPLRVGDHQAVSGDPEATPASLDSSIAWIDWPDGSLASQGSKMRATTEP